MLATIRTREEPDNLFQAQSKRLALTTERLQLRCDFLLVLEAVVGELERAAVLVDGAHDVVREAVR